MRLSSIGGSLQGLLGILGLVGATMALAGCPEDAKKKPLGGVCDGDGDCESGLCLVGQCLDPEADEDSDGLVNRIEGGLGSNPLNPDSDYDGVDDPDELTNQANRDTDSDGRADILESQQIDKDSDCLPDEFDPDNGTVASDLSSAVSALCSKNGVCRQSIGNVRLVCTEQKQAVCVYDDVPGYEADEATCDGRDNDCDGRTDEGYRDSDGDSVADCADDDIDGDGAVQESDNCPLIENEDQVDADGDDLGDACDAPSAPKLGNLPTPTNDTTPSVSGSAEALSIVRVFGDAECTTELGEGAATAAGAFTLELTLPGAGLAELWIQAENSAGLVSGCVAAGAIDVDLTAPTGVTSLLARALSWDESGATFEIEGRGEAGGLVSIYANAECTGTPVVDLAPISELGTFLKTADFDNTVGAIGVTIRDASGNVSACVVGPTLFGVVTVEVTREGKPISQHPAQFHYPDGQALALESTDETGIASHAVFAGCAVTVPVEVFEGYVRWVSVWGVVPGQTIPVPLPPQGTIIDETPEDVNYTWPALPEGATYAYIHTPCGRDYAYSETNTLRRSYYGHCLGEDTFDAVIYAYDDTGDILGYGYALNNTVPISVDLPTDVTFPGWETDFVTSTIRVENLATPSPVFTSLSKRLGSVSLVGAGVSAFGSGTLAFDVKTADIPGVTTDAYGLVEHLAEDGLTGSRGWFVPDATSPHVFDVADLAPLVVAAGLTYDNAAGTYVGIYWMAQAGLATAVDVGLFDMNVYGQNGSLDWQVVMAPRDEAAPLFPTFEEGFPGAQMLDVIYYYNQGNVTFYDYGDRDGFEDVIDNCTSGVPGCLSRRAVHDFTGCCNSNNRD